MSCVLSNTGLSVGAAVVVGALLLLLGVAGVVVFAARSRRSRGGGALVLLFAVGAALVGVAGGPAAPATAVVVTTDSAAAECPIGTGNGGSGSGDGSGGPDNFLTIVQTSVNDGLAPGAGPSTLAGIITNHGTAGAYITQVSVSVEAVEAAPDAAGQRCEPSDFTVVDSAMPVGRTLEPGDSASFGGASIVLSETGANQDACKSATLRLHYVSS